jgi:regulator of protease activity HflC (stomatin/prohibitin superfamily)
MSATIADGPVAQSIRIGFLALSAAMALLVAVWLASNIRQVPPGSQAVVLRLGRIVAVQQSGLVLAWPRPLDRVVLLPGGERQIEMRIDAESARSPGIADPSITVPADLPPEEAAALLTGDGGVVLLDAGLTWRISDAATYYVARDHVFPALRRLFLAAATALAARHDLDAFLVVRPERAGDPMVQSARAALRADLAHAVNDRLRALEQAGAGLGVEVMRVDVSALLPPTAKQAFDHVLDATQTADQGLAAARTDATRTQQTAARESDRILTEARATAEEMLGAARNETAAIAALEQGMDPAARPSLLDQAWRDRIGAILHQAGAVSAVDGHAVSRLILPGGGQR